MSETVPSVHPDLARHQASMQPRIYTLKGSIHCAFAYSIVNCTLIEGEDSCILVDTMSWRESSTSPPAGWCWDRPSRCAGSRCRRS